LADDVGERAIIIPVGLESEIRTDFHLYSRPIPTLNILRCTHEHDHPHIKIYTHTCTSRTHVHRYTHAHVNTHTRTQTDRERVSESARERGRDTRHRNWCEFAHTRMHTSDML